MIDPKCKICRRAGEKLFLKGERCFTPKCAMVKKPYPPGVHGNAKRMGRTSEYGVQLREKQRAKMMYGLREAQFANYVKKAIEQKINTGQRMMELLESRLDNVVFRGGLAISRSIARQLVSHGHILVNGRRVTIPSFSVKTGDVVKIRPADVNKTVFQNLDTLLKKYNPPVWLDIDKSQKEVKVLSKPVVDSRALGININTIIELYSR